MLVPDRVATITVRLIIVFASIFVVGALAFTLPSLGGRLSLPLLPSGIAVAAAYRWGRRMWPAVFLAGVAIELWQHQTLTDAIGVGAGLAGGALLAALIMERGGFDSNFARAKDVPLFIVAAAVGMTLAPTFGLMGMYLGGDKLSATEAAPNLWVVWIRWWSNTASGVFLVGPILLAYSRKSLARVLEHWAEGALWLIGLVICCSWALLAPLPSARPLIVVLANILVVVSAIRFGLVVAAVGSFAIVTVTALSATFTVGAFAQLDRTMSVAMIWSFIVSLSGLSLIITALLAERDSAALERLRAEHRYEQVFNGCPQPLWVHARDTLRFLLVNDAALRQYGWSPEELLMRTVEVLAAPGKQAVLPPHQDTTAISESATEPFETQHVTKAGRVLEVEVWTRSIDCGGQPAELAFAVDVTERRAFGQALMDAIGGEQRRIAEELHDGLGQELTGLALSVRAMANRAQKERDAISVELDQLALLATGCIQDAHRIVQGLSPLTNAEGNLEAALEGLAQRSSLSGIRVRFRAQPDVPPLLDLKVRNHLYRIAQEAVQNALKHSAAKSIEIELSARPGAVTLSVVDDGHGLSADTAAGLGLGMRTMRFRASAMGGRLSIRRGDGGGNAVVCSVPTKPAYAATA
jgi:PAS domain S-box-containing protein